MGERCWKPLAVAILGMSMALISYGVREPHLGVIVYVCGLASAGLALLHWFVTPVRRRA